jgi:hypothetical protein
MATTLPVNYIKHLNAAWSHFQRGQSLHATHVSLYLALFHTWNQYHFEDEFPIVREEIMKLCKIGSRNTYLRCLKDLHNYGLITYTPGSDINNPAIISITRWGDDGELLLESSLSRSFFDTDDSRYDIIIERGKGPENELRAGSKKSPSNKQYINNVKRERANGLTPGKKDIEIPSQEEVEMYFNVNSLSNTEARKFFFHYQARGWVIGGNPIQDWTFAARKWMMNIALLDKGASKSGKLNVDQNKRYDIPL